MAQPFRRVVLDQVGSTNREAFALAACGQAQPLWVAARRQTSGRGRSGRQWASEPGNLHASLLIQLECSPAETPQLSLVAGVATVDAIRQASGGGPRGLRLKWPNDVLIGQAKCAGILVETSVLPSCHHGRNDANSRAALRAGTLGDDSFRAHGQPQPQPDSPPPCGEGLGVGGSPTSDVLESPPPCPSPTRGEGTMRRAPALSSKQLQTTTVVIGIGINLAWHPHGLGRAATHLAEHGPQISADAMLGHLDDAMQRWLATWNCGADFASVRRAWLERAGPAGEACTVHTGSERIAGRFVDLAPDGALVIQDGEGRPRTVTFGDVALAPATPQEAT